MVSEYRKKKLLEVYNYYDADSSGALEKSDFDVAADNIAQQQKWPKDSPKYKEAQKALASIWENLQKEADTDGDGKVTQEEWLKMWEDFAKNPSSPCKWQSLYCKFTFSLLDASGNGSIENEEFCSVLQSFGLKIEDAEVAFKKIAKGKSTVTWEDYQELWKEYFTSENPSDPGNYIFGDPKL